MTCNAFPIPRLSWHERREAVLKLRLTEGDWRELALSSAWFDTETGDWIEDTPREVLDAADVILDMADLLDDFASTLDPCSI